MAFIQGSNDRHPQSRSPGGGLGGSHFWPFFPSPLFRFLIFPFILVCVHYPSSTYRVNLSKADTCPISPYPKSLGVVVKAGGCGSVKCRALNGSNSSFPCIFQIFLPSSSPIPFLPFLLGVLWVCRGLNYPRRYPKAILSNLGHSPPRLGPSDSPWVDGPGP